MIAILLAGAFALVFTLITTPLFAKLFVSLRWGQFIRDDGPESHHTKRGTPTMGGIVFIIGSILGYFVAHAIAGESVTLTGLLVLGLMLGLGAVGFIDDFLKTHKKQSLGLTGWWKVAGQVVVAVAFALLALSFPSEHHDGITPASTSISAVRDIPWLDFAVFGPIIATIAIAIWVVLMVVSTSNAVNVTDGLDGLATGASIFAFSAYILIGFWQFNQWCWNPNLDPANIGGCYVVAAPLDTAIVAASIAGALVGFLWWNTSPAQIFMGDTGSLGLGGALAGLAIVSRTELLLVLIGGLFIITTGSVILQRAYFKITRGKRIFLMSPLHHHFELKGWAEITVVVRFWLVAGLFVAAGVGVFYAEWVYR